ncbi:ABC transporter, ATP-binding protein, partial [Bordetella holmesii H620]
MRRRSQPRRLATPGSCPRHAGKARLAHRCIDRRPVR